MERWIKCLKNKYDKKGAKTILNKITNGRRSKQSKEQRVYYCDICRAWHLTSKDYDNYQDLPIVEFSQDFKKFLNEDNS